MSKLKEEELLETLKHWRMSLHKDYPSFQLDWTRKDEKAHQQMKEMIREDNIKRDMIIDNRLGIKKPEMTEEWIEKLIGDIIELILDDVDCHHEQDHDEDGVHISVEYNLNNETKLRGMIRELIEQSKGITQKPQVTKEWIEEKARKMSNIVISFHASGSITKWLANPFERCKDFIRSLIKEIQGGKHD